MKKTNRRDVLKGGAAIGLALPLGAAGASPAVDPIHAAIAKHFEAWQVAARYCTFYFKHAEAGTDTPDMEPENDRLHNEMQKAANELAATVPTTRAGVVVLLQYVADFDAERFCVDGNWSCAGLWPDIDSDQISPFNGKALELSFHTRIVRTALAGLNAA